MKGRIIAVLILGLITAPLLASAQQAEKVYQIGFLGSDSNRNNVAKRFLERFRDFGWIEGEHFVMVYQTAPVAQLPDRAPALTAELVRRNVDIIVTSWTVSALSAKAATNTIPIVMSGSHLPVENGLIESLAHPGGNMTGLDSSPGPQIMSKHVSLLKETIPGINRIAYLYSPWAKEHVVKRTEERWLANGKKFRITPILVRVNNDSELEDAFTKIVQQQADAINVPSTSIIAANVERIVAFANKYRLPTMTNRRSLIKAGALFTIGRTNPQGTAVLPIMWTGY